MASTGLIERSVGGRATGRRRLTLSVCVAVLQIVTVVTGVYTALHYIQGHIHRQPLLMLLLPPLAAGGIAIVMPLLMYISFQDDFVNLNPGNPIHYLRIVKRCYTALAQNNMKVAEKDL